MYSFTYCKHVSIKKSLKVNLEHQTDGIILKSPWKNLELMQSWEAPQEWGRVRNRANVRKIN